jgi:uncharacterized membrane protein YebE (DUF533 family)
MQTKGEQKIFDAKRLLDQLVSSGVAGGLAGGLAGGALANAVSGKKVRKVAGSALRLGGLALVGGLAHSAWQNYQKGAASGSGGSAMMPPAESAFVLNSNGIAQTNALSLLLARAMMIPQRLTVALKDFSGRLQVPTYTIGWNRYINEPRRVQL